ncbi:hypothetical protein [Bacillus sp. P14.5]|nr:hypothetical protein [Bacillus sp. P14.5]
MRRREKEDSGPQKRNTGQPKGGKEKIAARKDGIRANEKARKRR